MQINVGHLNEEGVYNGQFTTFALTGKVRVMVSSASAGLRGGVPLTPRSACNSLMCMTATPCQNLHAFRARRASPTPLWICCGRRSRLS